MMALLQVMIIVSAMTNDPRAKQAVEILKTVAVCIPEIPELFGLHLAEIREAVDPEAAEIPELYDRYLAVIHVRPGRQ